MCNLKILIALIAAHCALTAFPQIYAPFDLQIAQQVEPFFYTECDHITGMVDWHTNPGFIDLIIDGSIQ